MAIPEFLRVLRQTIGHHPLFLPGVNAVVLDDRQRVLLVRRADDGRWTIVGGIPEPGEQPATAMVREVLEETGVHSTAERLVCALTEEATVYPNGDRVQFLSLTFLCRATGGEARVNDDESTEVGWFAPEDMPPLGELDTERVRLALAGGTGTHFTPASA